MSKAPDNAATQVSELLRAAKEIRAEGHNGWGNVCADAAQYITDASRLLAEKDAEIANWRAGYAEKLKDLLEEIEYGRSKDAELQRLREDAERYRCLRAHSFLLGTSSIEFGPGFNQTKPVLLDAAIDAVRAALNP